MLVNICEKEEVLHQLAQEAGRVRANLSGLFISQNVLVVLIEIHKTILKSLPLKGRPLYFHQSSPYMSFGSFGAVLLGWSRGSGPAQARPGAPFFPLNPDARLSGT